MDRLLKTLIFLIVITVSSCAQKQEKLSDFIASQKKSWKKQLLINGEVGTPCETDYMKWIAKNPEAYYGLPATIEAKTFDANNDTIKDVLLYFPAGESCTGGHEEGSDFLKLLYSVGNGFLSNDGLLNTIANKIEEEFYRQTNTDVERAIFKVCDFKKQITGTYKLWTLEDPDCCASIEGTFAYDPFYFKITITHHEAK
ncbi:hypothetical protein OX284_009090 [Flavobacterium sp. SUN046]|uniref:hypothetical protein n=1 Tax=Flavobacterium sp. SUN046 TaxID=3002440 RepID=UPI002DB7A6D5|nr:hypothetical protein [Flavobacterium sp. SUN046]MEC4049581.1 hypothetical protein [Flavobacterium sp. SUN046]